MEFTALLLCKASLLLLILENNFFWRLFNNGQRKCSQKVVYLLHNNSGDKKDTYPDMLKFRKATVTIRSKITIPTGASVVYTAIVEEEIPVSKTCN
jgi:hypothetical protein